MLAVITARGGSKRLPGKNKKDFKGKPLIAWTIEAALSSRYLSRVVVSTDCAEIAKLSLDYGAEVPFLRDSALAQDKTSSSDVLIDVGVAIGILAISLAVMLRVIRKKSSNDEEYELHSFVPEKELSETPLPPIQDTKAFVKNWQELPSGNWLDKDEKGIQWYLANDGNYWYSTDGGYALYSKE